MNIGKERDLRNALQCSDCTLLSVEEPSVVMRPGGLARCNDCESRRYGLGIVHPTKIPTPREAWFDRYLANDKQARKEAPLARGLMGYFPNACLHVAHVSFVANEQHNPGLPLQWAFDKSSDEPDCEIRHMLDAMGAAGANPFDDDGLLHRAKKAWRALADLERYALMHYPKAQPGASVTGFTRASANTKENK